MWDMAVVDEERLVLVAGDEVHDELVHHVGQVLALRQVHRLAVERVGGVLIAPSTCRCRRSADTRRSPSRPARSGSWLHLPTCAVT